MSAIKAGAERAIPASVPKAIGATRRRRNTGFQPVRTTGILPVSAFTEGEPVAGWKPAVRTGKDACGPLARVRNELAGFASVLIASHAVRTASISTANGLPA